MLQKIALLLALLWCAGAQAEVELKIVTADGYVALAADDRWPVLKTSTDLPILTIVFQLPNAADEGTPDSTNLAVQFFDLNDAAARASFQLIGTASGTTPPRRSDEDGWTIIRQTATQGETRYTIIDAKRDLGNLSCAVRLAWPNLATNPPSYDSEMKRVLGRLLPSIRQHVGPYEPGPDEVVRRKSP